MYLAGYIVRIMIGVVLKRQPWSKSLLYNGQENWSKDATEGSPLVECFADADWAGCKRGLEQCALEVVFFFQFCRSRDA